MKVALALLLSATVAMATIEERWINNYDQPLHYECQRHQSISLLISMHDSYHEDRVWDFSCKNTFNSASCSWSEYVNDFDQEFTYICPFGSVITGLDSYHDNKKEDRSMHDSYHEDRVWDFSCKNTFNSASCSWSEYVNDFDQEFTYICPFGSVITGLDSYHDNKKEDRRWKFLCCQGEAQVIRNCKWSDYVNDFDNYLRWDAPPNTYLTGAHSYHDNYREDRRWKFYYCEK